MGDAIVSAGAGVAPGMTGLQLGLLILGFLLIAVLWVWAQVSHERWVRSQEALGCRFERGDL